MCKYWRSFHDTPCMSMLVSMISLRLSGMLAREHKNRVIFIFSDIFLSLIGILSSLFLFQRFTNFKFFQSCTDYPWYSFGVSRAFLEILTLVFFCANTISSLIWQQWNWILRMPKWIADFLVLAQFSTSFVIEIIGKKPLGSEMILRTFRCKIKYAKLLQTSFRINLWKSESIGFVSKL